MKPLVSETHDADALLNLGRASVQVVHDLKNQINGLKLYATFLRKRMEKAERPPDELETIAKLIAGLDEAAAATAALVRYGRPLELRLAPHTDLARLLAAAAEGEPVSVEEGSYEGDFDAPLLTEALKNITALTRPAAVKAASGATTGGDGGPATAARRISLRREDGAGANFAVIEWDGVRNDGDDPFHSFKGGGGLRLALAAKIVKSHGGEAAQEGERLRVRLPLDKRGG